MSEYNSVFKAIIHRITYPISNKEIILKGIKITKKLEIAVVGVYEIKPTDLDYLREECEKDSKSLKSDPEIIKVINSLEKIFENEKIKS